MFFHVFHIFQVNAEFLRITTKPLQTKFISQFDLLSDKLTKILEGKGGVKGQKIKAVFARKDSVSTHACIIL